MKYYRITYNGTETKFKGQELIWRGDNVKDALSCFFLAYVGDIFRHEDGTLKDECGNPIEYGEDWLNYDGGFFNAELIG